MNTQFESLKKKVSVIMMKSVIFFILLAGYALSATYSSNSVKKCGGLNPNLTRADITHKSRTGGKLELSTTPLNPGQMCNQDWAAIGLCCNTTQANAYVINDKKIIDDAVADLLAGLNTLFDIKRSLTSISPQFLRNYTDFTLDKVTINAGLSIYGCGEYLNKSGVRYSARSAGPTAPSSFQEAKVGYLSQNAQTCSECVLQP